MHTQSAGWYPDPEVPKRSRTGLVGLVTAVVFVVVVTLVFGVLSMWRGLGDDVKINVTLAKVVADTDAAPYGAFAGWSKDMDVDAVLRSWVNLPNSAPPVPAGAVLTAVLFKSSELTWLDLEGAKSDDDTIHEFAPPVGGAKGISVYWNYEFTIPGTAEEQGGEYLAQLSRADLVTGPVAASTTDSSYHDSGMSYKGKEHVFSLAGDPDAQWVVGIYEIDKELLVSVYSREMVIERRPFALVSSATRWMNNIPVPAGAVLTGVHVQGSVYRESVEPDVYGQVEYKFPGLYADVVASAKAGTLFPDSTTEVLSEEEDRDVSYLGRVTTFRVTPQSDLFTTPNRPRLWLACEIYDEKLYPDGVSVLCQIPI